MAFLFLEFAAKAVEVEVEVVIVVVFNLLVEVGGCSTVKVEDDDDFLLGSFSARLESVDLAAVAAAATLSLVAEARVAGLSRSGIDF